MNMPITDLVYAGSSEDPWAGHEQYLGPTGTIDIPIAAFLVRSGDRLVLIDAALGPIDRPGMVGGALLDELAAAGVQPGDITDVVFSHLHFDHTGWATQQGRIVFPNATYRCHEADWSHFITGPEPDAGATRKLTPIAERMETFVGDAVLAPGISVRHAPGHTPGSTVIVLSSGADRAVLIGDAAHCPVQLMEDEWSALYDVDPALATSTRVALMRELEGTSTLIGAPHFPELQFGRVLPGVGKRSWVV
ncbi:MAG: MBL fold metallo-hydrolase [Acidimicrobiia bacterium]